MMDLQDLAQETYGHSLAFRLQRRVIERARSGFFGSLRSRNAEVRRGFETLVMLLDRREQSVFLFGEVGTGKRRLIEEFHQLQKTCDRLAGIVPGRLKVLRGDHLQCGSADDFVQLFGAGDTLYIESAETLSREGQRELSGLLARGEFKFRLVVGTAVALSLKVAQGLFDRDLFTRLSGGSSVYLPSLADRSEDLTLIVSDILESLGAAGRLPSATIWDLLARLDLPRNLEDLSTLLRCLYAQNNDPTQWSLQDFPAPFRALVPAYVFADDGGRDALRQKQQQRMLIQRTLLEFSGDVVQAARKLGFEKTQLLQKMVALGIR